MIHYKTCDSLGAVWLNALYEVMKNGKMIKDRNVRFRDLGNIDNEDFKQKICSHPGYNPKQSMLEAVTLKEVQNLYFTISDISENDIIIKKCADKERIKYTLNRYGKDTNDGYGSFIYGNGGQADQFNWLIEHIKSKPETKSATITIQKPLEKPACLSLLDFKYRDCRLDMNIVYRSQNVYLKLPGNLLALKKLQNNLAEELGYESGSVELLILSAHIYDLDQDEVYRILVQNSCCESNITECV